MKLTIFLAEIKFSDSAKILVDPTNIGSILKVTKYLAQFGFGSEPYHTVTKSIGKKL